LFASTAAAPEAPEHVSTTTAIPATAIIRFNRDGVPRKACLDCMFIPVFLFDD